MATTRAHTGNSKPRILQQAEALVAPKKTTKTKANTSKPRTNKVAAGRVSKTKAPTAKKVTTTKKTTTGANVKTVKKPRTKTEKVVDAVKGAGKKAAGEVEGKPGKKAAGTAKARGTDSTTKRAAPKTKKM